MNAKNIIYSCLKNLKRHVSYQSNTKYIKSLRKTCKTIKPLTRQQKAEIQNWYRTHYGKKLKDYLWHEYYYARNGIFSPKYVPNYILEQINSKLYDANVTTAFDDKNLYYTIFPNVRQPKAYLNCTNGFCYINGSPITFENALSAIANVGEAIIKPTFCSCNGRGVKHLLVQNGVDQKSGMPIADLLKGYGKNYVIQEAIHQHEKLAALCPTSVNTIRIVTYRRNETDVVVIYAVMRIGKFGSEVDNTSAGGMTCGINEQGKLSKYAICSKPAGNFDRNEEGLVFENYEVPHFDDVVATAKKMHLMLPHFPMIGWDFTVNDNEEVVFVEMNAPFGLHQPAAGPGYGKYTEEIFDRCFGKNSSINDKN